MAMAVGGASFNPGEVVTLSVSGLDVTQSTAVFRYTTLSVSGTLNGSDWDFDFTADDSGLFDPTPNQFDCQIVYGDGSLEPVTLTTGERKVSTVASTPGAVTTVSSVAAGTGLSASPSPITATGTMSLDADTMDLGDVNAIGPSTNGQVLVWNSATSQYDPTTNFITTQATTNLSDVSSAAATDQQVLVYSASGSDWVPANIAYVPAPGSEIATNEKAYSPTTSNYKRVYVQSWFQAVSSGAPTGNVTLLSGSVDFVIRMGGYTLDSGNSKKFTMSDNTTAYHSGCHVDSSNDLVFRRGSGVDDAADGYFVVVWYTRSADAGGTL
jgi:hypothetical protein